MVREVLAIWAAVSHPLALLCMHSLHTLIWPQLVTEVEGFVKLHMWIGIVCLLVAYCTHRQIACQVNYATWYKTHMAEHSTLSQGSYLSSYHFYQILCLTQNTTDFESSLTFTADDFLP